jgi:hypothetical protein
MLITKLSLYTETGFGGRAHEELEVQGLTPSTNSLVFTWQVTRPRTLQFLTFHADMLLNGGAGQLIRLDPYQWWVYPYQPTAGWVWHPAAEELATLEAGRGGQSLSVQLRCFGLAQLTNPSADTPSLIPVYGADPVVIPASDWADMLRIVGYRPAEWVRLPLESQHWPNWPAVMTALQAARDALARGESRLALERCFGVLDEREPNSYVAKTWEGKFDVDAQKEEGLKALISGIAMYLNKVGRHPSRTERDAQGNLMRASVEQYEAEVLVAMTHLLVAYLERLPPKAQGAS